LRKIAPVKVTGGNLIGIWEPKSAGGINKKSFAEPFGAKMLREAIQMAFEK